MERNKCYLWRKFSSSRRCVLSLSNHEIPIQVVLVFHFFSIRTTKLFFLCVLCINSRFLPAILMIWKLNKSGLHSFCHVDSKILRQWLYQLIVYTHFLLSDRWYSHYNCRSIYRQVFFFGELIQRGWEFVNETPHIRHILFATVVNV